EGPPAVGRSSFVRGTGRRPASGPPPPLGRPLPASQGSRPARPACAPPVKSQGGASEGGWREVCCRPGSGAFTFSSNPLSHSGVLPSVAGATVQGCSGSPLSGCIASPAATQRTVEMAWVLLRVGSLAAGANGLCGGLFVSVLGPAGVLSRFISNYICCRAVRGVRCSGDRRW
ncbi:unnamed protein product, partial [Amoebophrya sp. A120]